MCGADRNFPQDLWHHCVHQAEITLNLVRPCPWDPTISAWEALHGRPWDWNAHPMAPIGTRVVSHEQPDARGSWAPRGTVGWYVGPAPQHYRCWTVVAAGTGKARVANCLEWFPEHVHMPGSSPDEALCAGLNDTAAALRRISGSDPRKNLTAIAAAEQLEIQPQGRGRWRNRMIEVAAVTGVTISRFRDSRVERCLQRRVHRRRRGKIPRGRRWHKNFFLGEGWSSFSNKKLLQRDVISYIIYYCFVCTHMGTQCIYVYI